MQSRRAGRERSKNGCLTCKIRRVKCDETSPHCRRCTETGRKCEGPIVRQYRFVRDQSASSSPNPKPQPAFSLLAPQSCDYERLDAPFWKNLVPCLSQSYIFVWDIVVCCSLLTEHGSYTSLTTTFDPTDPFKAVSREHRRALKHYNRAIANVQQLAQREQVDDSVVVLSYMLFASVEFQQQNVKTGNDLVKRCCRILTQNMKSSTDAQRSATSQAIHQVITPFIFRRAVVIATLGGASNPQVVNDNPTCIEIEAVLAGLPRLNEARLEFHKLAHASYNLYRLADFLPYIKDNDPRKVMFMLQRQSVLNELEQWKASFTLLDNQALSTETRWISAYLLMYWEVCYIMLAACISPLETIFDEYMHQFTELIDYATICLNYGAETSKLQILPNFDHGIVPPLYFCAIKCRHPDLRREALQLLIRNPEPEDLWAFIAPDLVVAKVISAEESAYQCAFSVNFSDAQRISLPPEECRYAYVSVVSRQISGGRQRQALEMSRFDRAIDGSRRLIHDYAWLDDIGEL